MGFWAILVLLFKKRKAIFGLVRETGDVITAIRNIRDEESAGGKDITKEEMLKTLCEVEDVLTKLKELFT